MLKTGGTENLISIRLPPGLPVTGYKAEKINARDMHGFVRHQTCDKT